MSKLIPILASESEDKLIHAESVPITWIEASGEGEETKLPTFEMNLYNGGKMNVKGYRWPLVVDIAGLEPIAATFPSLRDHIPGQIVGHCHTVKKTQSTVFVAGVISGTGAYAQEVIKNSKNDFPWQGSMGAMPTKLEFYKYGEKAVVNGQSFDGPVYVARKAKLKEASFVPVGADYTTSAKISASASNFIKENSMFEEWVKANYGIEASGLNDEQTEKFKAIYAASKEPVKEPEPKPEPIKASAGEGVTGLTIEEIRAENVRTAQINAACKDDAEICAKAISEGWSVEKAENHMLKKQIAAKDNESGVGGVPMINATGASKVQGAEIIEAATVGLSLRCGIDESEIKASDKVMEAGYALRSERLSAICAQALMVEGTNPYGMPETKMIRAALSTKSLSNILSNVVNKQALKGFSAGGTTWQEWTRTGTLPDFKLNDRVALYSELGLEELQKDGRIKNGRLGDAKESYRATRYSKGISIDEQTIIDDNLDMLTRVPFIFGQKGLAKTSEVVYTHFMSNPTMRDSVALFHSDHNNLITSNALNIDNLGNAITRMRKMKDDHGESCDITPYALLIPPELEQLAKSIIESPAIVITGSTDKKLGTKNVVSGYNLKIIVESRLSNSNYTGNSETSWYLVANPGHYDTAEVGFVNGVKTPVVEKMPAGNESYGVYYRAKLDVGAKVLEWRSMIKSTA